MPGGRPPKYDAEGKGTTVKKAQEYLDSCVDTKDKVNIPKGAGLARHLGITRSTLYDWADKVEEFSDILEKINQEQEIRLIDGGLGGMYNANIAKLVLGKHGYRDEKGLEVKQPDFMFDEEEEEEDEEEET